MDKAGADLKQRLREAGIAKEGKSYLEQQLESAAGSLGKMTVGSKMDRDGGDGTVGMGEGDGTIEGQPVGERGAGAPVGRRGGKLKGGDVYKGVGVGMLAGIEVVENETSSDEEEGDGDGNGEGDEEGEVSEEDDDDDKDGKGWWEQTPEDGTMPVGTPKAMEHSASEPVLSPNRLSKSRERGFGESVVGERVVGVNEDEEPPPPPKNKRKSVVEANKKRQKGVKELLEMYKNAEASKAKMKEDLGDLLLMQPR